MPTFEDEVQERISRERADARRRFGVDGLTGLTESEARRRVTDAAGRFEAFPADAPDIAMTADLRLDRVRVLVRNGLVVEGDVG